MIQIADNGSEIEAERHPHGILRHATSKFSQKMIGENIQTLGFGERRWLPLPVWRVWNADENRTGRVCLCYRISGGEGGHRAPGRPQGTTITVRGCFIMPLSV